MSHAKHRSGPPSMAFRVAALVGALIGLLAMALPPGSPASAQSEVPAPDPPDATPAVEAIGDDRISPELVGVAVESPQYDAAIASYRATKVRLAQAQATYESALRSLVELDAQVVRLERQLDVASVRHHDAVTRLDELQTGLEELAVATYIRGGTGASPGEEYDWEDATVRGNRRAFVEVIAEHDLAEIAFEVVRRERAAREIDRTTLLLDQTRARLDETQYVRDSSLAAAFVLTVQLDEDEQAVADARITAWVSAVDFQFVALDAYWRAAAIINARQPLCGVRWQIIAGISRVEGKHGTWRGSVLGADGRVSKDIIGIALNGENNTARIGDSDGGSWDGDGVYDRAVGPMQFLPSSWRIFGEDGNADGEADPQNIYDAALAAGGLLCRASLRLDTDAGIDRALLSYNHSSEYVEVVRRHIRAYDEVPLQVG